MVLKDIKPIHLLLFAVFVGLTAPSCARGPSAPFNFTVTSVNGAAELRWQYDGRSDRFIIERSEHDEYNFRFLAQTRGDELFYRDDTVAVGEWYFYRVAAFYEIWDGEENVTSEFCPYEGLKIE